MRISSALFQNGTFRKKRSSQDKAFSFNYMFAGFAALALFLAFASMREAFIVSRIVLFVLACLSAAAPFVFFAIGNARQRREEISNAISRERRHEQTRVEIRRTVKSLGPLISQHRAANDDPEAWSKAIVRFANENVFPAISHAVPRSEHDMWIMEVRVMAEALTPLPPEVEAGLAPEETSAQDRTFAAECVACVVAVGWDAELEDNCVRATLGAVTVLFECLSADAPVEMAAVDAFRRRLSASGVERGAVIATQPFSPAALQAARATGMGLIKPLHVPAFLEWAARGSAEPARAAN